VYEQAEQEFCGLVCVDRELGLKLLGDTLGKDYNLHESLGLASQLVYQSLEKLLYPDQGEEDLHCVDEIKKFLKGIEN
jgi:hypothetical protein